MKLIASLLLFGCVQIQAKEHYVVDDVIHSDHMMVQATNDKVEYCLFKKVVADQALPDQLCLTTKGSMSTGFKFAQESEDYDLVNKRGQYRIDLTYYLKTGFNIQPSLRINRLISQSLEIDIADFEVRHVSGILYNSQTNDMCMNVFSEIQDIVINVYQYLQLVECTKTLIDCLTDFGQYPKDDTDKSKKPFSVFSKYFDSCNLLNDATLTLKKYKPFDKITWTEQKTKDDLGVPLPLPVTVTKSYELLRKIQWIGGGTNLPDPYCFPGNFIKWIVSWEKKAAVAPNLLVSEQEGSFLSNFLGPMLHNFTKELATTLIDMSGQDPTELMNTEW